MGEETFPEKLVEKPKKNWLKIGLLVLISLFLLSGAFYAGYWYGVQQFKSEAPKLAIPTPTLAPPPTPTPIQPAKNQIDDWRTYENSKYKFSFKYPRHWFLKEDSLEMGGVITVLNYSEGPGRMYDPNLDKGLFKIQIGINKDYSDVSKWYDSVKGRTSELTGKEIIHYAFRNITVDDQSGVFYETEQFENARMGTVVFEVPSKKFLIFMNGLLDYSSNREYFNQILSTFQFLN